MPKRGRKSKAAPLKIIDDLLPVDRMWAYAYGDLYAQEPMNWALLEMAEAVLRDVQASGKQVSIFRKIPRSSSLPLRAKMVIHSWAEILFGSIENKNGDELRHMADLIEKKSKAIIGPAKDTTRLWIEMQLIVHGDLRFRGRPILLPLKFSKVWAKYTSEIEDPVDAATFRRTIKKMGISLLPDKPGPRSP